METLVYPGACSWYCSRAADVSPDGALLAYGCRNHVAVVHLPSRRLLCRTPPSRPAQRVACVSFSRAALPASPGAALLVTAGDDKAVRLWHLRPGDADGVAQASLAQAASHGEHGAEVTAVAFCYPVAVSGDQAGRLVSWDVAADRRVAGGAALGSAVTSAEVVSAAVVAVGCASGVVALVDARTCSVMSRVSAHAGEVTSMAWSPALGGMLATASRDRTLTEHCRPATLQRADQHKAVRMWVSAAWVGIDRSRLVYSGSSGELISWTIAPKGARQDPPKRIVSPHDRPVFSLCPVPPDATKIVSTGLDKRIALTDLNAKGAGWSVTALSGQVFSLSESPLAPGAVAAGVGDNSIRVWLTRGRQDPFDSLLLWRGVQTKATVVAFHPTEPGLLAYGTGDGHVGVYTVVPPTREGQRKQDPSPPLQLPTAHRNSVVYSLSWRACAGPAVLLSCGGDGVVLEHPVDDAVKDAANVDTKIRAANPDSERVTPYLLSKHSEASWDPSGNMLAIGNLDGSVSLFGPDYALVASLKPHQKTVTRLRWGFHTHGGVARVLLASASADHNVGVTDVGADGGPSWFLLSGHRGQVYDVSWRPHEAGPARLASASSEGCIIVWDVEARAQLAKFSAHESGVLSVQWSLSDPARLFSGGNDQTMKIWSVDDASLQSARERESNAQLKSEQPAAEPPAAVAQQPSMPPPEAASEQAPACDAAGQPQKQQQQPVEASLAPPTPSPEPPASVSPTRKKERQQRARAGDDGYEAQRAPAQGGNKSLFPAASIEDDSSEDALALLLALAKGEKSSAGGKTSMRLLCCAGAEARALVAEHAVAAAEAGNLNAAAQLELMRGDFSAYIERAVACASPHVSATWIGVAAALGRDVWEAAMAAQAETLERQNDYQGAVVCYLALQRVHDAISVYTRARMFADAVALARCRLCEGDPAVQQLLLAWAQHYDSQSMFVQAARCYVAAGMRELAMESMLRMASFRDGAPSVVLFGLRACSSFAAAIGHPKAQSCAEALRDAENGSS
eukprot:m51a1_g868 hypothetical protein (1023) ;mRNA; r:820788-824233